jgi:ABC-type branched-subunit amino acid transport system substrate-binding protein
MCQAGRVLALKKTKKFYPYLKIEWIERTFNAAGFLASFKSMAESSDRPDVVMIPGEEAYLGLLEPLLPTFKMPLVFLGSANAEAAFHLSPYIFSMGASAKHFAHSTAEFLIGHLKIKRVVIVRESTSDLDLLWSAQLQSALDRRSRSVKVQEILLNPGADLGALAQQVLKERPEIIFLAVSKSSLIRILAQFKLSSLSVPVIAMEDRFDFSDAASVDARVGHYAVSDYSAQDIAKKMRLFVEEFKRDNEGKIPDREAALCYDSLLFLAKAAQQSKGSLREGLSKVTDFDGLMGRRVPSSNRGLMRDVYFLQTQREGTRFLKKFPQN